MHNHKEPNFKQFAIGIILFYFFLVKYIYVFVIERIIFVC